MMMSPECVAPTGCLHGTSPIWSADEGYLWWVDHKRAKLHRFNPRTGNTRRYDLPLHASVTALWNGLLLIAGDQEIGTFDPATEVYEWLCTIEADPSDICASAGAVAPDGSLWFGMVDPQQREPCGAYFRLMPDRSIQKVRLPPVMLTQTFTFSPDRKTFYTCDSEEYEILAFDYDSATGAVSSRRTFAFTHDLGGRPYGSAVDTEGFLWTCLHGASRVVRFAPDGSIDQSILLAAPLPTACCFGGPDLRTLFITTSRQGLSFPQLDARPLSGSLFAFEAPAPGTLPVVFGASKTAG